MAPSAKSILPEHTKEDRVLTHDRQFACCRFNAEGDVLFAAGFDGLLHRFNLTDDKHDSFPAHHGWIESMALHPGGDRLFTADSWGEIHCWNTQGPKLSPQWTIQKAHSSWLQDLKVRPDGGRIATCGNDRMVRVFSTADGKPAAELKGHQRCVQSVAFHNDGKSLVSGDQTGAVLHWDTASGKTVRKFDAGKLFKPFHQYDQGGVRSMMFDDAYQTLYCAGFEGINANQAHGVPTVVAFDWESGKQKQIMTPTEDYKGPILELAHHPAGYIIGAGSSEAGGRLWFWKPGEEKNCHEVKNVTSFRGIDLHKDGLLLAAAAFGDRGGQRGGNGRRLTKDGEYLGFAGSLVVYKLSDSKLSEEAPEKT